MGKAVNSGLGVILLYWKCFVIPCSMFRNNDIAIYMPHISQT